MAKNIDELIKARLKKLKELKNKGINPYPAIVELSLTKGGIGAVLSSFESLKQATIAGRLKLIRNMGKITFAHLEDGSAKMQIMFKKDDLGDKYQNLKLLDIGDFIAVSGDTFKTKTKEKTVVVKNWQLLTKSVRPLPEKWHGLSDLETKQRQRYLDLIMNADVKERFRLRNKFIQEFRSFFEKNDFLEVETPVLEQTPGGADATPFVTHHETLDTDYYLRISLELHLKRLIVGGYEKVFEIGKVFRNEGMSREHLQEFTELECYAAYWDYKKLMKEMEKCYKEVLQNTFGKLQFEYDGQKIDFSKKWEEIDYNELLKQDTGVDISKANDKELIDLLKKHKVDFDKNMGRGKLIDQLYKKVCRTKIVGPAFLVNHPIEISPLAKKHDQDEKHVQRFQIIIAGSEIGNGFSELNDPAEQRKRFEEQMKLREQGDTEAHLIDNDYIEALEYGMPPTAGFGVGLDRLFVITANLNSIREAVLFPTFKPKAK
ncbi:MAG: lysine--tRNA ligase [bacterium]